PAHNAPAASQPATQTSWRPGQTIDFQVVHAQTGKPLPDIPLTVSFGGDNRVEAKTNSDGRYVIRLPDKEPYWTLVYVQPNGFVHRQVYFRGFNRRFDLPDRYTVRLTPGTTIGGIVRDAAGKPIEGASVYVNIPLGEEMDHVHLYDHEVKTDADGRWQCDEVPADEDDIRLHVRHQDYLGDNNLYDRPKPPVDQLRDKTHVITLTKGLLVHGTVTDLEGKPIKGALIVLGQGMADRLPQTKTDPKGQYRLACATPGVNYVSVYAKGHVPDQKRVVVAAGIPPVDFRLGPPHIIHGRVVDHQGRPLEGARVVPSRWRGLWIHEFKLDTDDQGRFRWDNAPPDTVAFFVSKKGYQALHDYPLSPSTADHVIRLEPTPTVKGAVVDAETGSPIPKFKVLRSNKDSRSTPWQMYGIKTFGSGRYEVAFDDLQKRYRVRIEADGYKPAISQDIPPGAGEHTCNFRLVKSDLTVAAATSSATTQPSAAPAQPPMTSAEAVTTIFRSLFGRSRPKADRHKATIDGVVTDQDARPIPGADVFLAQQDLRKEPVKTKTDAQGKFRIEQAYIGRSVLVARAPRCAPSQGVIRLTKDNLTTQMRLGPGRLLQGRVVDDKGQPLASAQLRATAWGDLQLNRPGPSLDLDLDLMTDADGRFRFDHAPPEGVVYTVSKEGYQSAEDLHLKPSPSPHPIILHPGTIVHGNVIDAATGKAVWEGRIEKGLVRRDGKIDWSRYDKRFTEGRYKICFDSPAQAYRFRVSADGYRPAVSPSFSPGQQTALHDVKLEPTDDLRGTALLPDGKPLDGGIVTVLTPSESPLVFDAQSPDHDGLRAQTKGDGSFTFRPQAGPFGLLVVDQRGWAEVPSDQFTANPEFRLQPWARVEGTYRVGGKPLPHVKLDLRWRSPDRERLPKVSYTYDTQADAQGRFVFERVRPGTIEIADAGRFSKRALPSSYDVTVTVEPGQTRQVNIGGPGGKPMGRVVTGRIVPPHGSDRRIDWSQDQLAYLHRNYGEPEGSTLSIALRALIREQLKPTSQRGDDPSRPESYDFRVAPDGSFRIGDVVPASYRMHVTITKGGVFAAKDEKLGELEHAFTVPPVPLHGKDEPIDLGELTMTLYRTPQPGEQAPMIEIPSPGDRPSRRRGPGKTFRLADYVGPKGAGKLVLLTFWSNPLMPQPWHDAIAQTYRAFGADGRLVMVFLRQHFAKERNLDRFLTEHAPRAIRVNTDSYADRAALGAYAIPDLISGAPRVFLIAPDGTVLAANLHPSAIKRAVATALAAKPKPPSASKPAPTTTQATARDQKPNDVRPNTLDFRAVDHRNASPLPGVRLQIAGANVATAETDAKGKCAIPFAQNRAISLFITATKPGFVPLQVVWSNGDDPAKKEHAYTLTMEHGRPIGGIVKDDQGRPVKEALVTVNLRRDDSEAGPSARIRIWDQVVRTDDQGRWRYEPAPKRLDALALRVTAPGFSQLELSGSQVPAPGKLGDMTAEIRLERTGKGTPVPGRVIDQKDRPIVGATVVASPPPGQRSTLKALLTRVDRAKTIQTDAEGRFCLYERLGRRLDVLVRAPGLAPLAKRIEIRQDMEPLVFKLEPGRPILGRVVDSKGKPVSGVIINVENAVDGMDLDATQFVETDDQGRFEWRAAANDRVSFRFWKPHYKDAKRSLNPSDDVQTITLYRQIHVSGKVIDAATGKPIERFQVVPHTESGMLYVQKMLWSHQDAVKTSPGRYEIKPEIGMPGMDDLRFRIEAAGYKPFISPKFTEKDEDVTCDVKLHPAQYLTGQVLTPDG
ncbi:MAG: carboxypeptidase regulatory-like domain-containing protein, partial [Phycisphaerae bacterium]|nr:carboxypeptidase regulatory-like domain-containing protein [Phycisphaerae bacterium]